MNYYAHLNNSLVVDGTLSTTRTLYGANFVRYDPATYPDSRELLGATYDKEAGVFTLAPIRVIRKDAWTSRMSGDELAMLRGLYDAGVGVVVGFYDWFGSQPNVDLDNPRYLAFFQEVVSHYPADQTLIDLARAQAILADGTVDEL